MAGEWDNVMRSDEQTSAVIKAMPSLMMYLLPTHTMFVSHVCSHPHCCLLQVVIIQRFISL